RPAVCRPGRRLPDLPVHLPPDLRRLPRPGADDRGACRARPGPSPAAAGAGSAFHLPRRADHPAPGRRAAARCRTGRRRRSRDAGNGLRRDRRGRHPGRRPAVPRPAAHGRTPGRLGPRSAAGRLVAGGLGLRLALRQAVRPALPVAVPPARSRPDRPELRRRHLGGPARQSPGHPCPDRADALVRPVHRRRRRGGARHRHDLNPQGTATVTLPWLILIPFLGGLLCWLAERFGQALPRWIALAAMGLLLALGLWLWTQGAYSLAPHPGDPQAWALELRYPWIARLGIDLHLALDGLSLLMVVLTGLLGVLSVLCSWSEIQHHVGFFHLNLLWILGGVVGVFLAMDLFLFFFFWEMMLVPMYFLIALWGHSQTSRKTRITAATKFFIYTQASGLLMLIAILGLVLVHYLNTGRVTFDYAQLLVTDMPPGTEYLL